MFSNRGAGAQYRSLVWRVSRLGQILVGIPADRGKRQNTTRCMTSERVELYRLLLSPTLDCQVEESTLIADTRCRRVRILNTRSPTKAPTNASSIIPGEAIKR